METTAPPTATAVEKNAFITNIPGPTDDNIHSSDESYASEQEKSDDEGEDQEANNQLFEFSKAEPPTNYNDPYSTLPPKIKLSQILVSTSLAK
jgi:hypothetical protein